MGQIGSEAPARGGTPGDPGKAEPRPSPELGTPRRVLVADDSRVVRRVVRDLLEAEGQHVVTASSGEEAFELCLREDFDALVSDVTMGALSGFQLCRLVRSDPRTAEMPVLLLTAAGDPRSRFWGRNAGADVYLSKEAMREELWPAVRRMLRERPAAPERRRAAHEHVPAPMERLAQVLDRHLFEAVLQGEIHKLMDCIRERAAFVHALIETISQVCEYAYLVVRLEGPEGPSAAIHARGPWPDVPSRATFAQLGIPAEEGVRPEIWADGPGQPPDQPIGSGEMAMFPVRAAGEQLGELMVFSGDRRLGEADRQALETAACALGVVTKPLFLWEETRRLARTDELTGLANRRTAVERLEHEIDRRDRTSEGLAVLMCDIDHFKKVNDTYGHGVGDTVLRRVAEVLQESVRRTDLIGRWGGEEFLVVLPGSSAPGARVVAERLRQAVSGLPPVEGGPEGITLSIGGAVHQGREGMQALTDRADHALYRAKERGRNRVEINRMPDVGEAPDGSAREADR